PINNLEKATKRQNRILNVMLDKQIISKQEFTMAQNEELIYAHDDENKQDTVGTYFQDTALREAAYLLDMEIEAVRSSALQIYTTLDLEKQEQLEKEVKKKFADSTQ